MGLSSPPLISQQYDGYVQDVDREPIVGATVRLRPSTFPEDDSPLGQVVASRTDEAGRFAFDLAHDGDEEKTEEKTEERAKDRVDIDSELSSEPWSTPRVGTAAWLIPGTYDLWISAEGYGDAQIDAVELGESDDGAWPIGTVTLEPELPLTVHVVDRSGASLARSSILVQRGGARWRLEAEGAGWVDRVPSDDAGFVRVPRLSAEVEATLRVRAPGHLPVVVDDVLTSRAVETRARGERWLRVELEPGFGVVGTLSDRSGQAIEGVVRLTASEPGRVSFRRVRRKPTRWIESEEGRFVTGRVPAGRWWLEVAAEGFVSPSPQVVELGRPGQQPGSPVRLDLQLDRGRRLVGRVLDEDGDPVEGATIDVAEQRSLAGFTIKEEESEGTARSDRNGRFEVRTLPEANLSLTLAHPDFVDTTQELESASLVDVDSLPVETRETAEQIASEQREFILSRGRHIAGVVRDFRGEPVVGAWIRAQRTGSFDLEVFAGDPLTETTAGGRFEVVGLEPAEYRVSAGIEGLASARLPELADISVESVSDLVIVLEQGERVLATLIGLEEPELAEARVLLVSGTGDSKERAPEVDGTAQFEGVATGQWTVLAQVGDRSPQFKVLSVEAGGEHSVVFEFEQGARLSGTVLFDGEPLVDADIMSQGPGFVEIANTSTDAEGRFTLQNVSEGEHTIVVSSELAEHRELVEVEGDTDVLLELEALAIRGRVVDSDGVAVYGARVVAGRIGGGLSLAGLVGSLGSEVESDEEGFFEVAPVASGEYRVRATLEGEGQGEAVARAAAEPDEVIVRIEESRELWLTVFGADGQVTRATIAATPLAGGAVLSSAEQRADEQGRFRLVDLPVGGARLFVSADSSGTQALDLTRASGEVVVQLGPPSRLIVDVPALRESSDLPQVRVLDALGRPVGVASFGYLNDVFYLSEGRVEIVGLPEGPFTVEVTAGGAAFRGAGQLSPGGTQSVVLE